MTAPGILGAVVAWAGAHYIISTIIVLLVLEQLYFRYQSRGLPNGPSFVVPLVGCIPELALRGPKGPDPFWRKLFNQKGLGWSSLLGKLMVVVNDLHGARKIFESTSDKLPLVLHWNAMPLLGADNIAHINGPPHKILRQQLLPLFTPRALSVYLGLQESTIREHLKLWFADADKQGVAKDGLAMQWRLWDLNTDTSIRVFVGAYTPKAETRRELADLYRTVTKGFLSLPINLPGTDLNLAIKARHAILERLTTHAGMSKQRMRKGEEPECLLDFWMEDTIKLEDEAKSKGTPMPMHTTDEEVAAVLFDFLFASQDASTSSLTYAVHLLSLKENASLIARIRDEYESVFGSKPMLSAAHGDVDGKVNTLTEGGGQRQLAQNTRFDLDSLTQLKYTHCFMKELLRWRPPATIVPHIAKEGSYDVTLKQAAQSSHTLPQGALVIPSIWAVNRVGYTDPESFDPERYFDANRAEDKKNPLSFLTFGAGPHVCLGQRYAMNHLTMFISLFSHEVNCARKITDDMHLITYMPTLYPADSCPLESLSPRTDAAAAANSKVAA